MVRVWSAMLGNHQVNIGEHSPADHATVAAFWHRWLAQLEGGCISGGIWGACRRALEPLGGYFAPHAATAAR
jgi:hypothetical protein